MKTAVELLGWLKKKSEGQELDLIHRVWLLEYYSQRQISLCLITNIACDFHKDMVCSFLADDLIL